MRGRLRQQTDKLFVSRANTRVRLTAGPGGELKRRRRRRIGQWPGRVPSRSLGRRAGGKTVAGPSGDRTTDRQAVRRRKAHCQRRTHENADCRRRGTHNCPPPLASHPCSSSSCPPRLPPAAAQTTYLRLRVRDTSIQLGFSLCRSPSLQKTSVFSIVIYNITWWWW